MSLKKGLDEWLWDFWCLCSLVGIWPRFLEPSLLTTSSISISIPDLPKDLTGFKIVQFSDLHWHSAFSRPMLAKLQQKICALKPDLIVFTGDLLSKSHFSETAPLKKFLQSLTAPAGCFAVLGNHDYARYVTLDKDGDYAVDTSHLESNLNKGLKRLFSTLLPTGHFKESVKEVEEHPELCSLYRETPFRLLKNETLQIPWKQSFLNLTGLEDYMLGRLDPKKAFNGYDPSYPGIVLCHNPDAFPLLKAHPGDLLVAGHTHGGQVNLPGLWRKFCMIEHPEFKRGLCRLGQKWAYINRGIGGLLKFRWCSLPEITLFTLR